MKHILFIGLFFTACSTREAVAPPVKHLAQTGWASSAGAYADRVPNGSILREDGGDSSRTEFYCLRIGLYDSTTVFDRKLEEARSKYYQLDMYKDWVLSVDGDTIVPAFFQPVPAREQKLTEQVVVYEIPRGAHPSMLIYKDPYKLFGNRQTMLIHEKAN